MRKSLSHLPAHKRAELDHIVRMIFDGFDKARKRHMRTERGEILKLILFGSYARGDWVEDHKTGFLSDYDLLVIVNDETFTNPVDYWIDTEEALLSDDRLLIPVNLIVHSLEDVNEQLERGRYFFADIVRQGIMLYDKPGHPLGAPKLPPPAVARAEAQAFFEQWFEAANTAYETYELLRTKGNSQRWRNKAAFELHQMVENLYHCVLLTLALYTPKLHNLFKLRALAEQAAPELIEAWPRNTRSSRHSFELLKRAYVEGRYSPHYAISATELDWLATHARRLRDLAEAVCRAHLASPLHAHQTPRHPSGPNLHHCWEDEA